MVKNSKIDKYYGEIEFDDLMECVKYIGTIGLVKKPYILDFNGKTIAFKDTAEVVPYVANQLHIKVTRGEAYDFNA